MKYSEDILIRHSQIDFESKLKTGPLVDLIQDVEAANIEKLTVFNEYNLMNKVAIFITYRQIDIIERPKLHDVVTVNTYPYLTNPFYGYRETVIFNQNKPIIVINTLGAFVDLVNHKPTKLPKQVIDSIEPKPQIFPLKINRKIEIPKSDVEFESNIPITKGFIDYYLHVNNSFYILFSESVIPHDFEYNQIRTEYRRGLQLGEIAILRRYKTKDGYCVIVNSKTNPNEVYTIVEFNKIIGGLINVNE